jgi:hypothetical protein
MGGERVPLAALLLVAFAVALVLALAVLAGLA